MSVSHHHLHRNSSIRRAIRSGAGMASFPYAKYAPVPYAAKYDAYGFFHKSDPAPAAPAVAPVGGGGGAAAPATQQQAGGVGWVGTAAEVVGGLLGGWMTTNANQKALDAQLASQEAIATTNANAMAQAAAAQAEANRLAAQGGISGGTIAMILGGVVVVGGAAYFVFRKKKQK